MEERQVICEIKDKAMYITFHNPEIKNGLTWQGYEQLANCFQRVLDDRTISVVIYTGDDQYFFTGGRVDASVPGENEKYANALARYTDLLNRLDVFQIAAISGDCLKGGMSILARSDIAVAREGVEFGFPEVRMGGVPMLVMANTINLLPKKAALEAYCTSWNFSAQDAYRQGLINRVVPKEEFWPTVERYVEAITSVPRTLIDMTRKAYYSMVNISDQKERSAFAMRMLREEVLPAMKETEKEYNV